MTYETFDEVQSLLDNEIPEGDSLEYKQTLELGPEGQRREVLKDLSGMGNAGGGSVIFGISEDPTREGVPDAVSPMSDARVVGRLEDVVWAGIRPPLSYELQRFPVGSGFVLVANVRRSPLGPYMVEAYRDRRYHIRVGTRTFEMTEQQVRDAYALVLREAERRDAVREAHALPLEPPTEDPWLTISALPHEPLSELLTPTRDGLEAIRPPSRLANSYHAQLADLKRLSSRLSIWADGVHADDTYGEDRAPSSLLRVHRNGAAGLASIFARARTRDEQSIFPRAGSRDEQPPRSVAVLEGTTIARILNAYLMYLAWLWKEIRLTNPTEIDVRLENLQWAVLERSVHVWGREQLDVVQPLAAPMATAQHRDEMLPWELLDAVERHRLIKGFLLRLYNAFGLDLVPQMFDRGWLYGSEGFLKLAVSGCCVWSVEGNEIASVESNGVIRKLDGQAVAFYQDGVILDESGDCAAALEFATGAGLPTDFFLHSVVPDPRAKVHGGRSGEPRDARDRSLRLRQCPATGQ
jgi:hypothetical protein